MVVKNELSNLSEGLAKIKDCFCDVIVVDTGSTDGTKEYLRDHLNIEPLQATMNASTAYSKSPPRNMGFSKVRTEWILSLDADERISLEVLDFLRVHEPDKSDAGFFGLWRNYVAGMPRFDDYKLFLFRRYFRKRGLVHENAQVDIREAGKRARWLDPLVVDHFPNPNLHSYKTAFYQQRLETAIKLDPSWIRHHWFLGYMHFDQDNYEQAIPYLEASFYSDHPLFPVERLNSGMVLVAIMSRIGAQDSMGKLLMELSKLYESVCDDFEVQVNQAFIPWLKRAIRCWQDGRLEDVERPRFAR